MSNPTIRLRRRPSRTWPAGITAVVLTATGAALATGALLWATGSRWAAQVGSASRVVGRAHWSDPAVIATSAGIIVLGVIVIIAALAPGRYGVVPVEAGGDSVGGAEPAVASEFVLSRRAVARLAATAAGRVNGISTVDSVRAAPGQVFLRVHTPSASAGDTAARVRDAVRRGLAESGLRTPPRVRVAVRTQDV